jgi:hypothetical protein
MHTFTPFHKMRDIFFKIFYTLLFLCALQNSHSQRNSDNLIPNSVNARYLEHLIKTGIDSIRIQHGLTCVFYDTVLYAAAKRHVHYLDSTRQQQHDEAEMPKWKDVTNRVAYYGGDYIYRPAELIARTYVAKPLKDSRNKPYVNVTYQDVCNDLIGTWLKSKKYKALILNPWFDVTGIAITISPARKEVKAVVILSEKLFVYTFNESETHFPYRTDCNQPTPVSFNRDIKSKFQLPQYEMKRPSDSLKDCGNCNTVIDTAWYRDELVVKNQKVTLLSWNTIMIKELLKEKGIRFAVEVIPWTPFDCDNPDYYSIPSRRAKTSLNNGYILEPVKRRALKKGFKGTSFKALKKTGQQTGSFEIKLGVMPDTLHPDYYELNLLILKGKKLCRVMHISRYPGNPIKSIYKINYLTDVKQYYLNLSEKTRTLKFTVPFETGKSDYNKKDIQPLIDSLHYDGFVIENVQVKAFSSLEGDSVINTQLQQKRGNAILKVLTERQKQPFSSKLSTHGSMNQFRKQITENKELSELYGLTNTDLLKQINANPSKFEEFLKVQRRAEITMSVRIKVEQKNLGSYLLGEFYRMRDSVNFELQRSGTITKIASVYLDSMTYVQGFAYNRILDRTIDTIWLERMELPVHPDFSKVIKDHFWYMLSLSETRMDDPAWEKSFYTRLTHLDKKGITSFQMRFDMCNYLVKSAAGSKTLKSLDPRTLDLAESLKSTEEILMKTKAEALWVNALIIQALALASNERRTLKDDEIMRQSCQKLCTHFSNQAFNDSLVTVVADFIAFCKQEDLAFQLIESRSKLSAPYPPLLAMYHKLKYEHIEEKQNIDYFEEVINSWIKMDANTWCSMFSGPGNISFQAFDYIPLRNFFCEKCNGHPRLIKSSDFQNLIFQKQP